MLKEWQFNVLFFIGVGGALFLLIAPELGFSISQNPTAVTGIGAILTYVLTQKRSITGSKKNNKKDDDEEEDLPDRMNRLEDLDKVYRPSNFEAPSKKKKEEK